MKKIVTINVVEQRSATIEFVTPTVVRITETHLTSLSDFNLCKSLWFGEGWSGWSGKDHITLTAEEKTAIRKWKSLMKKRSKMNLI